jgi:tetratricopeptide (TPR) repeat protein
LSSKLGSYKFFLVAGICFLAACSVEKNTETTRFYHSLTARFNIYFNGYESYKAGVAKVGNGHRDDYAELLNVFDYSDPATKNMGTSDFERAIQKASKLISLKSITAKPEIKNKRDLSEHEKKLLDKKEYNEWVDDSYLLIGKSRFYKHEYSEAETVLNYCINEASDPYIKTEATIWLSRTKTEKGDFAEASRLLKEIAPADNFSKGLKAMYYTTLADIMIRQKNFSGATEPLAQSIELVSGKRNKYRLTYLLAQIYEQQNNSELAGTYYRKVVNMNPPYEVEFNARINIAGVFDINSGNPGDIQKELERMLRDSKNKEFQDQIYFALGNLSMKEGNEKEGLEFFRKSAASRGGNPNQKGRSYLALSDYFYKNSDYIKAGSYLDSAVFFLEESYPQYTVLKAKSRNLNDLVSQLTIIEREDSLQRVALMPESQRTQLIETIIADVSKAETQGKTSDYNDRYNIGQYYENERRFQGNIEQEGKWYFYNQSAMTFGRTEFRRRWGDRKLQDNWRRANKATVANQQILQEGEDNKAKAPKDTTAAINDKRNPLYYMKDLPLTDSLLILSNERISLALLNAGKAYAEKINDSLKAASAYETLIQRFPSGPEIPEALYDLYRLHEKSNRTKAEAYRQLLVGKYPESEFARILSDPAYYKKRVQDMQVAEKLYEEAYDLYAGEKFNESVSRADYALSTYPKNELSPKFMLLRAYSIARISDERTFKENLRKLTEQWPGTPESKKAQELIAHINQEVPELKVEEDKVIAAEIYVADTASARTFVLIIPDPSFNLNQANFDVISYNIDYFTNKNYKTEGSLVDKKFLLITVNGFPNFSQALSYYKKFLTSSPVRNSTGAKFMSFVISSDNLARLRDDKDPGRYELFFRENFLK